MQKLTHILRLLYYGVIIRPLLLILLGLNARHLERLHVEGAKVIAANHNSHLDAMVLMSLFKLRNLKGVKVVAAKDYFCRTPFMSWVSLNIIGIIPIDRSGESKDPLAPVLEALDQGYKVIMFPEGSRGSPEARAPLKFGIAKLLELRPEIPITPVFMHGLGKSLPRGEALFVPFVCEINIGKDLKWQGDRVDLMSRLDTEFNKLEAEMEPKAWK